MDRIEKDVEGFLSGSEIIKTGLKKDGTKYTLRKYKLGGRLYSSFDDYKILEGKYVIGKYFEEQRTNKAGQTYIAKNLINLVEGKAPVSDKPDSLEVEEEDVIEVVEPGTGKVVDSSSDAFEYKQAEADKYELGMARNNAAVLFATVISSNDPEKVKEALKKYTEDYDHLVIALFNKGKKIRKQVLGY